MLTLWHTLSVLWLITTLETWALCFVLIITLTESCILFCLISYVRDSPTYFYVWLLNRYCFLFCFVFDYYICASPIQFFVWLLHMKLTNPFYVWLLHDCFCTLMIYPQSSMYHYYVRDLPTILCLIIMKVTVFVWLVVF